MEYKGNLKGDALKHFKWKGRRKSTNVIKAGGPNSRRRVEFEKEQQKRSAMKKAQQKRRVSNEYLEELEYNSRKNKFPKKPAEKARQKRVEQERLEQERRNKVREVKRKEGRHVSNEYLEELEYNSRKNEFPKKPAEKPAEKASKEQGMVKVKAFVRKLANGTIINVRSFLRRVAKKLGK